MKKQGKKWMLVVIALLALVTVALPLVGCKNDSVSEQTNVPEGEKPTTPEGGEGKTFKVTFNANGGKGTMEAQTFTAREKQALTANSFTRDGYTFSGWSETEGATTSTYSDKQEYTATKDTILYAVWTEEGTVAKVSFNPTTGVVSEGKVTLKTSTEGAKIEYKLDANDYQSYTAPITISKGTKITAKATKEGMKESAETEKEFFTVDYANTEGSEYTGELPTKIIVVSGTTLTGDQLEVLDETDNYTFAGWYDEETKAEADKYTVTDNVTLTAKWTEKGTVAKVTFDPEAGEVDAGTKVTLTTETKGATIQYHLGDEQWQEYTADTEIIINGEETITVQVTKNGMLASEVTTARYTLKRYTVSFNTKGGGSIVSQPIVSGQKATKPADDPTLENNVFGGWYSDEDLTQEYSFDTAVTDDTPLYAKWIEVEMVSVPGNTTGVTVTENSEVFIDGRTVILSAFEIGKYEVTQELYKAVMTGQTVKDTLEKEHTLNANPSNFTSNPYDTEKQEKRPVEKVSWYDAVYFCNELTKKTMSADDCVYTIKGITVTKGSIDSATVEADFTKKGYRLPTEAEWEYAARGGNPSNTTEWNNEYAGTNDANTLETHAWYFNNSENKTHEVGKKETNSLWIHDMTGNVWEWCWDWHDDINAATPPTGPETAPALSSFRVIRGGSWYNRANGCRVSDRSNFNPFSGDDVLGFRVVRGL